MTTTSAPTGGVRGVLFARNFFPYFAGNLLSNSGTWFQNIAQVLLVYRLSGSTFLVGVVNFSQFAAILLLASIAGNAADRWDRRKLVIVAQACAAVLAAALAVLAGAGLASTPVVIAVALALGCTTAFATPALQAIVVSLVDVRQLPSAVALNAVTFNLSRALGPVAGVFVIAQWGIPFAFAVNSFSYLALVAAMLAIRPATQDIQRDDRPRLRQSFRMVKGDTRLLAPVAIVGLVSLTIDPVTTLTPAFSTQVFDRPDTFTGFLVGAFGAGAVAAAFTVSDRFRPSFGLMVVTLGLLSGGIATFALSSAAYVGLAALFVAGFGYLSSVTAATSLLQLAVEESHRGRVMALWSLSFHGVRPIGSLFDGAAASWVGVRPAGLVMALPGLAACLMSLALRASDSEDQRDHPAR